MNFISARKKPGKTNQLKSAESSGFFFLDHRGVHRNKKSLYSLMNDH